MSLSLKKKSQKEFSSKVKDIKKSIDSGEVVISEQPRKQRVYGVVYLSHVPHGFYEEQMKSYFSQFGTVLRVRLVRSAKTGKSRGHAFIKFLHPEVAKIVAETMDNYLMCNRLMKAVYVPPEKQHPTLFRGRNWSKSFYPTLLNRKKTIKQKNANQNQQKYKEFVKKQVQKVKNIKAYLKTEVGINYAFRFADIPHSVDVKELMKSKKKQRKRQGGKQKLQNQNEIINKTN